MIELVSYMRHRDPVWPPLPAQLALNYWAGYTEATRCLYNIYNIYNT